MGQGNSATAGPPSPEELALRLTDIFAERCFSSLELQCFKQTFSSLAEEKEGVRYWSKATLVTFLELPDTALGSGPALYHLCGCLGAFPFPTHAPAVLTGDSLLRVVCLMTGRYMKVLDCGKDAWIREIFRACAEFKPEAMAKKKSDSEHETNGGADPISMVKDALAKVVMGEEDHKPEEDELAFHTFQLLDALEVYEEDQKVDVRLGSIPAGRFLGLLKLLLLIAPLGPGEDVSIYTTQLDAKRIEGISATAKCIMTSFGVEGNSAIRYDIFEAVVTNTLPHLFDSFGPLFERLLFPKDIDGNKDKGSATEEPPISDAKTSSEVEAAQISAPEPLLPTEGEVLDFNLLSQLSFILSSKATFHRLQPLYLGHANGYSISSFENSISKWRAPSILLVSGTLISPNTKQSQARAFLDELPHRRLPSSAAEEDTHRIVYGAYIPGPWETTSKSTFGTDKTTLFQLSPTHDVFPASNLSSHYQNYAYFNKPPALYPGLGFGSPLPAYNSMTASQQSSTATRRSSVTNYSARDTAYGRGGSSVTENSFSGPSSPGLTRRSSLIGEECVPLGPVSLHINDGLDFGVFTHVGSGAGSGTFRGSKLVRGLGEGGGGGGGDWQDRFEIEELEVWGIGDGSLVEEQRQAWVWEQREAERRGAVNLSTGDKEADKELLRMSGLIRDGGWSGGSL